MVAMVRKTIISRPNALNRLIASRVDLPEPMILSNAKRLDDGTYRLQSSDGVEVSMIYAEIPLTPSALYLIEFTAKAAQENTGPLLVNFISGSYIQGDQILGLPEQPIWQGLVIDSGSPAPHNAHARIYTQSKSALEISNVSISLLTNPSRANEAAVVP